MSFIAGHLEGVESGVAWRTVDAEHAEEASESAGDEQRPDLLCAKGEVGDPFPPHVPAAQDDRDAHACEDYLGDRPSLARQPKSRNRAPSLT